MLLSEFTRPNRFTPDEKKSLSHRSKRLISDENDIGALGYSTSTKYQTVMRKLAKNGWSSKSSGYFSKVYTNPSKDYIIKLNVRRDTGFLWFMFLTRKFPNIHFPKIMDAKILFQMEDGKALYAYKMEKLQPLYQFGTIALIVNLINRCIEGISDEDYVNVDDFIRKEKYIDTSKLEDYLKNNPRMKEAINVLGKYSRGHTGIDLSPSNFMQRNDGTIVINDPFAS